MQLLKILPTFGTIALMSLSAQAQKIQVFACPDGSKLNFIQDKNSSNEWSVIAKSNDGEDVNFEGQFQGLDESKLPEQADLTEVKLKDEGVFELICKYRLGKSESSEYFNLKTTINNVQECKARVNFFMCI